MQAGGGGGKYVSAADVESMLRRLMPCLEPLRFQHLMRIVRNDMLCRLEGHAAADR
jgi:hypothetical protein